MYEAIINDNINALSLPDFKEDDLYLALDNKALNIVEYILRLPDLMVDMDIFKLLKYSIRIDYETFLIVLSNIQRLKDYTGLAIEAAIRNKRYILNHILNLGLDDYKMLEYAKKSLTETSSDSLLRQLYFYGIYDDESRMILGF